MPKRTKDEIYADHTISVIWNFILLLALLGAMFLKVGQNG